MVKQPYILNIYDIPTVENICNQILREVIKLESVSLAHVLMYPKNVSLLHNHYFTNEKYFILSGRGILYLNNQAYNVKKGAYVSIDVRVPHKLKNISESEDLEHLVISTPSFDPRDIKLILREFEEPQVKDLNLLTESHISHDGATVYELNSLKERTNSNIGIAVGYLKGLKKAKQHYHIKSEEVYFVIRGEGTIKLDDKDENIGKGSLIYIPQNIHHSLKNTLKQPLEILCLSSPPYSKGDFILI